MLHRCSARAVLITFPALDTFQNWLICDFSLCVAYSRRCGQRGQDSPKQNTTLTHGSKQKLGATSRLRPFVHSGFVICHRNSKRRVNKTLPDAPNTPRRDLLRRLKSLQATPHVAQAVGDTQVSSFLFIGPLSLLADLVVQLFAFSVLFFFSSYHYSSSCLSFSELARACTGLLSLSLYIYIYICISLSSLALWLSCLPVCLCAFCLCLSVAEAR